MKLIELPVSKYKVEIRDNITFGEFKEIENYFKNRMKLEITGEKQSTVLEGSLDQQMQEKMVQTYLHSCRIEGGEEKSTIGLLNTLDAVDGAFLENEIGIIHDELKKKLTPTTKN